MGNGEDFGKTNKNRVMNLLTEMEIKNIISDSVKEMKALDTRMFTDGKLHHYFSKAFVAGIGKHFSKKN